jgi:pteridine reductase
MKFQDKTVFITGGAKRIGAEIARFFAKEGAKVVITYNSSSLEALALKQEIGENCHIFKANLEDTKSTVATFNEAISKIGKIHILINNASVFQQNSIQNITEEEFERDFTIQLKTPLFLIQAFAKQNFAPEEGLIINMLDKNIIRRNTNFTSYLLSKKALDELTRFSAFSLAPQIRANSISPGFILEEENVSSFNPQDLEQYMKTKMAKIPLKRKGSPQDIVKAIDFLATNSYINGININVDGGSFLF